MSLRLSDIGARSNRAGVGANGRLRVCALVRYLFIGPREDGGLFRGYPDFFQFLLVEFEVSRIQFDDQVDQYNDGGNRNDGDQYP